jgi:hypothetical protein
MYTGNASQLSDGASACLLMEEKFALQMGLEPLGIYVYMYMYIYIYKFMCIWIYKCLYVYEYIYI